MSSLYYEYQSNEIHFAALTQNTRTKTNLEKSVSQTGSTGNRNWDLSHPEPIVRTVGPLRSSGDYLLNESLKYVLMRTNVYTYTMVPFLNNY